MGHILTVVNCSRENVLGCKTIFDGNGKRARSSCDFSDRPIVSVHVEENKSAAVYENDSSIA
jgi:hypothetical protein